ncbi:MAG: hypothetical protein NZ578_08485 [Candidatus Binatia bacterium]|nr:hypothetical protein [Candidatus Binatia bacterium]
MPNVKQCEKCRKQPAVMRCVKNGGTVWWFYCMPCFQDLIGEQDMQKIEFGRWGDGDQPIPMFV